jgi:hypothetical protein
MYLPKQTHILNHKSSLSAFRIQDRQTVSPDNGGIKVVINNKYFWKIPKYLEAK